MTITDTRDPIDRTPVAKVDGTVTVKGGNTDGQATLGINMIVDRIWVDASAGLGDTFRVKIYEADAVVGTDSPKDEYDADLADSTDHVLPMDYPHIVPSDKITVVVNSAVAADKDIPWKVWGA